MPLCEVAVQFVGEPVHVPRDDRDQRSAVNGGVYVVGVRLPIMVRSGDSCWQWKRLGVLLVVNPYAVLVLFPRPWIGCFANDNPTIGAVVAGQLWRSVTELVPW